MLLFVDGGTGRHGHGSGLRHGGIGCVAVEHNGTTRITGFGKFFHHDTGVTNQRMELRAIHFATEVLALLDKPADEPLYIWSDSIYSINTLRWNSDWSPSANLDLIVPFRRELQKLNIVELNHVKSHIRRKTKNAAPDFMLHEMADRLAAMAIKRRRFIRTPIMETQHVDTACLGCSLFPCRQRKDVLDRMRIREDYVKCRKFKAMRSSLIKKYSVEDIEEYCLS